MTETTEWKYKIKLKNGKEAILVEPIRKMPKMVARGEAFCKEHGGGWPNNVEVWEELEEKSSSKKKSMS